MKLVKLFFVLSLLIIPMAHAMDPNNNNSTAKNQVGLIIEPTDMCMVRIENASDVDSENIFTTSCCKQFLCHECYVNLMSRGMDIRCPHCRRDKEFGIEKAQCPTGEPFPFERLPKDVMIRILLELARIDTQESIDSYKNINMLSLISKYLYHLINNPDTINELMKKCYENRPSRAATLGIPGAITWIDNNYDVMNSRSFLINLGTYYDLYYRDSPETHLSRSCVMGFLKSAKLLIFPCWILVRITSRHLRPEESIIVKKMLTHSGITFQNTALSTMLEAAIRQQNQWIIYLLLQKPNLRINEGLQPDTPNLSYCHFSDTRDTPLMLALKNNAMPIVYQLLSDPRIDVTKQVNGKTALDIAKEMGNQEAVMILESIEEKLKLQNNQN